MGTARLAGDPDRYIRTIPAKGRGGHVMFQVRPYRGGVRYDLGLFLSILTARKARDAFERGEQDGLPRFVKRVRTRSGEVYLALGPVSRSPAKFEVVGRFPTREEAAFAAAAWVRQEWPGLADRLLLRGTPTKPRPPRPAYDEGACWV